MSRTTASAMTIAQVSNVVETGSLDPENVVTPSIYVDRIVVVQNGAVE